MKEKKITQEIALRALQALAQSRYWVVREMARDHGMTKEVFISRAAEMVKPPEPRQPNPLMPHEHMSIDEYQAFCREASLRGTSPARLWYLRQHGQPEPPMATWERYATEWTDDR